MLCVFLNTEILEYVKHFRRSASAFDKELPIRKLLFPNIQFSDPNPSPTSKIKHDIPENSEDEDTLSRGSSLINLSETTNSSVTENSGDLKDVSNEHALLIATGNHTLESDIVEDHEEYNRLVDKILVVGRDHNNQFKAVGCFTDAPLDSITFQMLEKLKTRDMTPCQKYVIPAVLSGQNVCLIDGPKSGKTVGVFIALISLLRSSAEKSQGLGARAIVVCPHAAKCEMVQETCLHIIQGRKNIVDVSSDPISVNVAYGLGTEMEKKNLIELLRGYDILACTPRRLLRLLEKEKTFDFKRLSHIVFDDMNFLLSSYENEIQQIFVHMKRKSKSPQKIIISNHWIPSLRPFVEKNILHEQGFLLIPCYLNAALFVHLNSVWRFIASDSKKLENIIDILNDDFMKFRNIVVCFNDNDDVDFIHEKIKVQTSRQIYKIRDLTFLPLDDVKNWRDDVDGRKHPVLFCTDYALRDLHIYEADCLIHYSLPQRKIEFLYRFSVLLDRLQNVANQSMKPKKGPMHPLNRPQTFIFSNAQNVEQFPAIIDIMQELHAQIPDDLKITMQKLLHAKEMMKRDRDICLNIKQFGCCVNESRCEFRHIILEEDFPDPTLPASGYVKVHIVHVFSATHFGVRLLEQAKEPSGVWSTIGKQSHPGVVILKLKDHFAKTQNKKLCMTLNIGDIVAVEKKNVFYRVKIIRFVGVDISKKNEVNVEEAKYALVRSLDEGWHEEVATITLMQLPKSLASISPTIIDIFICNLLPIDEDIAWGNQITNFIREKIIALQNTEKTFFYGKVELVLNRDLWLDSFECKKLLPEFKDSVTVFSVSKTLRDQQMAIQHDQHLNLLRKRCRDELENCDNLSNDHDKVKTKEAAESIDEKLTNDESLLLSFHDKNTSLDCIKTSSSNDSKNPSLDGVKTSPSDDYKFAKPVAANAKSVRIKPKSVSRNALKPIVEWHQDSTKIYIKINVNSENFDVRPMKEGRKTRIYFCAQENQKLYEFDEVLFSTIKIPSVYSYKSGVWICIKMTKLLHGIRWKQLFRNKGTYKWIRHDQNFIESSDDDSCSRFPMKSAGTSSSNGLSSSLRNNVCREPAELHEFSDLDSTDDVSDDSAKGCDSDN